MNKYISSDEAIRLYEQTTPEQTEGAPEIFLDFLQWEKKNGSMDFGYAARALFNAGRVAGIREEREKQKMTPRGI